MIIAMTVVCIFSKLIPGTKICPLTVRAKQISGTNVGSLMVRAKQRTDIYSLMVRAKQISGTKISSLMIRGASFVNRNLLNYGSVEATSECRIQLTARSSKCLCGNREALEPYK